MDFSTRLFELRGRHGLKQVDLAAKINVKSSAVSKYEKGLTSPTIDTLIKLSEIFSVSVDYLLGVSDIPNPYTAENFTPKEANIILKFRKLSKEDQIRIDERIKTMLDSKRQ